jgi:hypothetical protein
MKIDVNVDVSLKDRAVDYVGKIVYHIENRQPFILYHDKEYFVRVNPSSLAMIGYDKEGEHQFACASLDEFLVRLKLFILTHENFRSCIPQIEEDAYRQLSNEVKEICI